MNENGNNEIVNEPMEDGGEPKINPGAIRKSTTQSILKAIGQAAGTEFESVEALAAAMARMSAVNAQSQKVTDQSQNELTSKRVTTSDLHEQFANLKQDLAKKEQMLRERELDNDIRATMGSMFDDDLIDYALTKVKSNIIWEDGSYVIVNSKNQMRYNDHGEPMTINDLVKEVAKSNPKLLKTNNASMAGSGLRPREGMFGGGAEMIPDYATDPAAFNAWASRMGLGKGVGLKSVKATVSVQNTSKKVV